MAGSTRWAAIAALAALSGCANGPGTVEPQPIVRKPVPPYGYSPALNVPQPGADGRYATINSGIGGPEALWHVRAALNVAALGCRKDPAISKSYNQFLTQRKTLLASAYESEARRLGTAALDQHSTRLYNFFAQPGGQRDFCRAAAKEATQIAAVAPAGLDAHASAAVDRLETPFLDFYRSANRYRKDLAAYEARPKAAKSKSATLTASSRGAAMPALIAAESAPANEATDDSWSIQIGAFTGRAAAEAAWAQARAKAPGLARYEVLYEPVPGRSDLVRVRLGKADDRDGAIQLCAAAATGGFDCIPVPRQ